MKKKIISILLAITFVLSFAIVPSMAEGPLSVELLADKTNFVTSTDRFIFSCSCYSRYTNYSAAIQSDHCSKLS